LTVLRGRFSGFAAYFSSLENLISRDASTQTGEIGMDICRIGVRFIGRCEKRRPWQVDW